MGVPARASPWLPGQHKSVRKRGIYRCTSFHGAGSGLGTLDHGSNRGHSGMALTINSIALTADAATLFFGELDADTVARAGG